MDEDKEFLVVLKPLVVLVGTVFLLSIIFWEVYTYPLILWNLGESKFDGEVIYREDKICIKGKFIGCQSPELPFGVGVMEVNACFLPDDYDEWWSFRGLMKCKGDAKKVIDEVELWFRENGG